LRISAADFGLLPPWVPFLSFAALLAADFAFAESADPFCGTGFDCVLDFEAPLVLVEAFESPFGGFTIAAGQERWTLRGSEWKKGVEMSGCTVCAQTFDLTNIL
jgi:hypothetical protein